MTTTSTPCDPGRLAAAVEHGYADSTGTRIHFAALGAGPLLVLIHGFPDYWYTWRHQMPALAREHRVVAMDLRGYHLSDQPPGVASYTMPHLLADVRAVITHHSATVIGHDWGGAIGWALAMTHPTTPPPPTPVGVPVLMIHGLDDPALLPGGLSWLAATSQHPHPDTSGDPPATTSPESGEHR